VGRNPSDALREVAAQAGVRVTGTVQDVRLISMRRRCMCALAHRRRYAPQVFEALSMGKAVVSTGVGVEGLPLASGEHFLQADDPVAFASAVVALLRDPARRHTLGLAGQRLTRERYAWSQVAQEFGACCEAALG